MSGSSAGGALRFADPLGPRGRRRVMVATVVATVLLIRVRLALAREQRRVVIDDPAMLRPFGSPVEARAD